MIIDKLICWEKCFNSFLKVLISQLRSFGKLLIHSFHIIFNAVNNYRRRKKSSTSHRLFKVTDLPAGQITPQHVSVVSNAITSWPALKSATCYHIKVLCSTRGDLWGSRPHKHTAVMTSFSAVWQLTCRRAISSLPCLNFPKCSHRNLNVGWACTPSVNAIRSPSSRKTWPSTHLCFQFFRPGVPLGQKPWWPRPAPAQTADRHLETVNSAASVLFWEAGIVWKMLI